MTSVECSPFGTLADGRLVHRYTLRNGRQTSAGIISYGGRLISLTHADRNGTSGDVVLGYETLAQYLADESYLGALIGRCANRIADGQFSINGTTYRLPRNDGRNTLHGGREGFHAKLWAAEPMESCAGVRLTYESKDGEGGFPGKLLVEATYVLRDDDTLVLTFNASTSRPTVINLTNHTYFNLTGRRCSIEDHEITIAAGAFTPINGSLIPTGEIRSVADTPFDLRTSTRIGAHIDEDDEQIARARGFDHNFVIDRQRGDVLSFAARLTEPTSGRSLEVWTSQPGVQFYSGNFLKSENEGGKPGAPAYRTGLCLETQHFPNSPNEANFPTTSLNPGETFESRTEYRFSNLASR